MPRVTEGSSWDTAVLIWGTHAKETPSDERKGPLTCGGAKGTRTPNPLLAKQVRYQLRHGPSDTEPAPTREGEGGRHPKIQFFGESVASAQSLFSACLAFTCFWIAITPTAVATTRRSFFTGSPPGTRGIGWWA
jgi:hypothetical protein